MLAAALALSVALQLLAPLAQAELVMEALPLRLGALLALELAQALALELPLLGVPDAVTVTLRAVLLLS